jgi:hypothetical protein
MLGDKSFYHSTIRNMVLGFGTLFNNTYISKLDGENNVIKTIKVPISYGPKEMFLRRLKEDPMLNKKTRVGLVMPRMSFQFVNLVYDPTRKLNTLNRRTAQLEDSNGIVHRFERVPYNFQFELNTLAKTNEDSFQMVEQILPAFTPEYTITMKHLNALDEHVDIPVVLTSINETTNVEEGTPSQGTYIWTLGFTMKGYLYPPVAESGVIKRVIIDINDYRTQQLMSRTTSTVVPFEARETDPFGIDTVTIENEDGTLT